MLLAPGNLPAVAKMLPTQVVLLSRKADITLIHEHPMWKLLLQVCAAETRTIDDLITHANHTATLTLSFERAIRSYGDALTERAFILWNSDFLVADESLTAVAQRFIGGASAICAGNFQVVAEDAIPLLRDQIEPDAPAIAVSSQDLLTWSLTHLHPATIANTVNAGLAHNEHINRLFWRIDKDTLIGRFYLMHPVGIRPEITDFIIGSSYDYSFIPEMCPSGNIEFLKNSNDYFVVELQKREHECENLLPGPILAEDVAICLNEWTTAQHRLNVKQTVIYQGRSSASPKLQATIEQADAFIEQIGRHLAPLPQPHRNHPYWIGSIAVNRARSGRALGTGDWRYLLANSQPNSAVERLLIRFRLTIFGTLPQATFFHPRLPDYALLYRTLADATAARRKLLLVADDPMIFAQWLASTPGDVATLEIKQLLRTDTEAYRILYEGLFGTFDESVVLLPEQFLDRADKIINRVSDFLTDAAGFSIAIISDRPVGTARKLSSVFAAESARLLSSTWDTANCRYVRAGWLRWLVYRALRRVADIGGGSGWRRPMQLPLTLGMAPFALIAAVINLWVRPRSRPPTGIWSSIFLTLGQANPPAGSPDLKEPLKSKAQTPSPLLAAQTTRNADDDTVGRYRFVARLLPPGKAVAEYLPLDHTGSLIVAKKAQEFAVYHPAPEEFGRLLDAKALHIRTHDILSNKLPASYDVIFTLDTLDRIAPGDDEDRFIRNLRRSLSGPEGLLIFGIRRHDKWPLSVCGLRQEADWLRGSGELSGSSTNGSFSLRSETGAYLDKNSSRRRLYVRTRVAVRALLENHFKTALLFSVVDGELRPGADDDWEYLFAICGRDNH
jgi:hypothetical protein